MALLARQGAWSIRPTGLRFADNAPPSSPKGVGPAAGPRIVIIMPGDGADRIGTVIGLS